jgi:hypothetical protein
MIFNWQACGIGGRRFEKFGAAAVISICLDPLSALGLFRSPILPSLSNPDL